MACWRGGYSNASVALGCYHYPNTSAHGGFRLHVIAAAISVDTTVCFPGVLVLPLYYSPNLQQCLRSENLLNGDLGKILLQKLMSHGVSVVPVFPCLRGL